LKLTIGIEKKLIVMNEWIEISTPSLRGNEIKYLTECITSNFVSTVGPFINRFEEEVSIKIGIDKNKTVATSSGTAALQLGLISVGVKPNDLVVIPSYTFIATANAISYIGAKPWIMDIESKYLTLNPLDLEKELEKHTYAKDNQRFHKSTHQRIACIVPVFVFGHSPDLNSISNICKQYSIPILIDSACGIGSKHDNKNIGQLGIPGIISFNGNKTITSGSGGIFFSHNDSEIKFVRHLASTAKISNKYDHDMVGFNYRMSNIQAALGLAQLEQLENILKEKKEIHNLYRTKFYNSNFFSLINSPEWSQSSFWINFLMIKDEYIDKSSDLIKFLNDNHIRINYFWKPIPFQDPYLNLIKSESAKKNIHIQQKLIPLPSTATLKKIDQIKVINLINKFFKNNYS
tara:strand:+ start:734 stop:1945 length:1212 start_codon:yes stop_codon:yes gene_type:complete